MKKKIKTKQNKQALKRIQFYKEGGINTDYSGVRGSLQPFKNIIRRYKYFSFGAY